MSSVSVQNPGRFVVVKVMLSSSVSDALIAICIVSPSRTDWLLIGSIVTTAWAAVEASKSVRNKNRKALSALEKPELDVILLCAVVRIIRGAGPESCNRSFGAARLMDKNTGFRTL